MTSSMLTGERRWASARRGGMTVLGKVAVPKPINLPSQRLENHGLDPSVEIVPKGTHSWGSRSSSSTPNAWGSSTLSPNTDGGSGSPSHLSGRPSSGSGTRPSTANSDKTHEPIANAWGSNSRPSSASGVLTSNQTSLAPLRPRSAETRPGSSQLSRFADPLSDNSVAWGATGTAEKLGVGSSKNHGFSLASGDFPTLGSEKENSGKNMESQDGSHSRPGSSSGGIAPGKESNGNSAGDASIATNAKIESSNSWRRENPMHGEDGPRPSIEKWHPDPQPYPNSNIHPQNYDAWRGPPVNNHPGGAWYRGPPGGPHFAPPVPPGGFPMEPFPYFHPQQGPPPGPLPRGPRPTNGDIYRPHMHDAYIRPGMPFGPGFYPGPVPYEGYYRPPMGYCNSAERDIPFMGMAVGPANYNRYSGQNAHDPGNSHGRSGGYGPSGPLKVPEQVESGHPQDAQGPYKVLLKQHDGSEGKDVEPRWDDTMTANTSYPGKVDHRRKSSWENDWRADDKDDEEKNTRRMPVGEASSFEATDNRGGVKSLERVGNRKAADDSSVNKLEHAVHMTSAFPEFSGASKDPSLIKKIEGLNAKARASDGRQDVKFVSSREEQKNKLQVGNAKSNHPANETNNNYVSHKRTHASGIIDTGSHEDRISDEDNSLEVTDASGTASSRRSTHGVHSRGDRRGKGRFNTHEADGWRKRSQAADMPNILSSLHFESFDVHRQDHTSAEAIEKSGSYQVKDDGDGESMPPHTDLGDSQTQRDKMKELAIQRIKQREKEEEERTRDQKAKALAKLEELNKRTKSTESVIQKSETASGSVIQDKQEEPSTLVQPTGVAESSTVGAESSISLSCEVLPELLKAHEVPIAVHDQVKPFQWDTSLADATHHNNAVQISDSRTSKQKHVSYRQKQNSPLEKTTNEKLTSSSVTQEPKSANDVAADAPGSVGGANEIALNAESSLPINPTVTVDSVHHKRKSRTGKNKHKAEEASSTAVVPALVSKETTALDTSVERGKSSEAVLDPSKFQFQTDSRDGSLLLDQRTSSPNEEAHGKIVNQWKPQHTRRMQRNPQANKSAEKFQSGDAVIWAPVRSQNKMESIDEGSEDAVADAISPPMKNDQQMQSNPRNKRAEMERYIPKPVAKEMAQQGSSHQSVASLVDQITPEETVARPESSSLGAENSQTSVLGMGKVGSVMESRNGEGRHGKSGKPHGSWRQRSAVESNTSSKSRSVQKSIEHHQAQKPDASTTKEQSRHSEASDGWNIPENSDVLTAAPAVKDQGATARGRRHTYKGQKGTGYNHDLDEKRINSGDTEKVYAQPSSSEMHQSDLPVASKENRAVGDRSTSHWQPKSQPLSATNQRGRTNGGQNVSAEVGRGNMKDSAFESEMQALPQSDKETTVVKTMPCPDHALSEKSNLEEVTSTGHQEGRKERKISYKGRPGSPVELSSSNMDFRHEQRGSSGFRKNGNQNSRFGREQDSRGDWSGSGKDNKQHNVPANRERQRHNSHYEYQPVGPQSNNKTSHFESAKDGSHNSGARPRERGQSHPRRGGGNFYGRQTGSVRVEASYD